MSNASRTDKLEPLVESDAQDLGLDIRAISSDWMQVRREQKSVHPPIQYLLSARCRKGTKL